MWTFVGVYFLAKGGGTYSLDYFLQQ